MHGGLRAQLLPVTLVALATAYVGLTLVALQTQPYTYAAGLVVAPFILVVTIPVLLLIGDRWHDPVLGRLLVVGLVVKLLAALVRYGVGEFVYGGIADAGVYVRVGAELSEYYRLGLFGADIGVPFIGTGFIRMLTGLVFAVTGPTVIGGFLVYAWLGFCGLVCFLLAFMVGFPEGNHRRYALLLCFLPGLVYWPASVGKEAWMLLTLGLATLGAALVLRRRALGHPLFVLGAAGAALVRPHMALLAGVALGFAYLIAAGNRDGRRTVAVPKVAGLAVLAVVSIALLQQVEAFFDLESADAESAQEVLDGTTSRTDTGGSRFEPTPVRSPLDVPQAAVTVLLRPFPHEAHNTQARVAAIEGLLVAGLLVLGAPRIGRGLRRLRTAPFLAFAVTYTMLFVVAFSSFANFGLLARQRVQVLPALLVLVALPQLSALSARARSIAWRTTSTSSSSRRSTTGAR